MASKDQSTTGSCDSTVSMTEEVSDRSESNNAASIDDKGDRSECTTTTTDQGTTLTNGKEAPDSSKSSDATHKAEGSESINSSYSDGDTVHSKTEPTTTSASYPDVQGGDTRLPDSLVTKETSVEDITNGMSEVKLQESTSECSNYENELPKLETAEKAQLGFEKIARRAHVVQPKQLFGPSSTENSNKKEIDESTTGSCDFMVHVPMTESVFGRSKSSDATNKSERSECTNTKIGQSKMVTEKTTHSIVTTITIITPGRTETKTENNVTETITITEEGGQTPEMTNTTNEEERPELSDHDVKEEESSGQSGVRSKTEPATTPSPAPQQLGVGGGRRSTTTTPVSIRATTPATNSAKKGKEFEEEFKNKVDRLKLKCEVSYQTPIDFKEGEKHKKCIPDAVFRNEKKAVIVELKNYDKEKYLESSDVNKLVRDMAVVKEKYKCTKVWGYIYFKGGQVSITEDEHASREGIIIVREAEKTVEKLVRHIKTKLKTV